MRVRHKQAQFVRGEFSPDKGKPPHFLYMGFSIAWMLTSLRPSAEPRGGRGWGVGAQALGGCRVWASSLGSGTLGGLRAPNPCSKGPHDEGSGVKKCRALPLSGGKLTREK